MIAVSFNDNILRAQLIAVTIRFAAMTFWRIKGVAVARREITTPPSGDLIVSRGRYRVSTSDA
jgi:hypothetical protein